LIRSGIDIASEPGADRALLVPAALSYYWRFS